MPNDAHRAIEAVWRIESARLIAGLARLVRDLGLAEDLAHDALVAALEQWPGSGVPDNPGAWLMATAKHRAIDRLRRSRMQDTKHQELAGVLGALREGPEEDLASALDDDVGDDLLGLMFIACHPVLSTEARVALTLRLVGGLTTEEIARAFLVPVSTLQQRIVRAKRTLTEAHVPFELPRGADRAARLASVLEVLYLVFNEGYSATAGDDWVRPALCEDALPSRGSWPNSHRTSLRSTAWSRCWRSRPRGSTPVSTRRARRCCSSIKIDRGGINCSSGGGSRPGSRLPTRSWRNPPSPPIICCRASVATCSKSSAASKTRAPSSRARPR
jgi:RNA polymerase sigma factor (sigma-70 family)